MKEQLIKLRFILDRLSLRERVMILVTSLLLILVLWMFLIFLPQKNRIEEIKLVAAEEKKQTAFFAEKGKIIEQLARDKTLLGLIRTYQDIQKEIQQVEQQITRFKHRYISSRDLSRLLYSILEETQGVSIEDFSNAPIQKRGEDAALAKPQPSVSSAVSTQSALPSALTNFSGLSGERTQYILTLKGDYFSIMNYLKRLEQSPWQLYWDKLNYKVEAYPQAAYSGGLDH